MPNTSSLPLHLGARHDQLAPGANRRAAALQGLGRFTHPDCPFDIATGDVLAALGAHIERGQHIAGLLARRSAHREAVAARRDVDRNLVLDQRQMLVVLAADEREQPVVIEGKVEDIAFIGPRAGFGAGGRGRGDWWIQRIRSPESFMPRPYNDPKGCFVQPQLFGPRQSAR
jgi:hypothetical protein